MNDDQWYYTHAGQRFGPVPISTFPALAQSGQLAPADFVWREGMPDWVSASTLGGVFQPVMPPQYHAPPQQQYMPPGQMPSNQQGYGYPGQYDQQGAPVGTMNYYSNFGPRIEFAGFWLRLGALLIDGVIFGVLLFLVGIVLGIAVSASRVSSSRPPATEIMILLIFSFYGAAFIASWLYYALMESGVKQSTLGQRAVGIKVTDLEGRRIGFGRATGRYFGKLISQFFFCFGFIMAAFTEKKQALHDMMAGTLIVRK